MNIELVVFDLAGTTVRDDDSVNICLREALASHVQVSRDETNALMGLPKPIAIRTLLERNRTGGKPAPDALVDSIYSDFVERMVRFYQTAPNVEPMPHTLEAFCELKEAGVRIALDTGFARPIVTAFTERLDWHESLWIDASVASDEVLRGRPYPDMIVRAMELTRVRNPRAVAKVGDTPSDLQEGTAAGCGLVIGLTHGTHTRAQLESYPHTHLLDSLSELPSLVVGNFPFGAHEARSASLPAPTIRRVQ